jgi:PKD repeat protein
MVEQFWSFASIDQSGYLSEASVEYKMIDNNVWLGPDVPDTVAPVANAGADQVVDVGASVSFDGSASFDNVGIAEFNWDFGDGSRGSGVVTSHVYARSGVYDVTLTVKDGKGNVASDFVIVTVRDVPSFSVPGPVVGVVVLVVALFVVWLLFRRR